MEFFPIPLITAFITGIIGPILIILLSNKINKYKENKKDTLVETINNSNLIYNRLDEIKNYTKADRIFISQFHNGGNFYPTGKSIQKFSIIYELVSPDISSIQSSFSNIPVSLFSQSINQLLKENNIIIPDYKDSKICTYGLKYIGEGNNCKSTYLFSIRNLEGRFIAILGLDYVKSKKNLDISIINDLLIEAASIGGALNTFLQK